MTNYILKTDLSYNTTYLLENVNNLVNYYTKSYCDANFVSGIGYVLQSDISLYKTNALISSAMNLRLPLTTYNNNWNF